MNEFEFYELYDKLIKREGAEALKDWLQKSDFSKAPASTKYHGSYPGGLLEHSLNVYYRLEKLVKTCWPEDVRPYPTEETLAIVALLHDLCKVNFYAVEMRNRKNEYGQWEQYPFYIVDDKLPYGHGEKSVYIISGFMKLTREEAFAIRFHMGDYSDQNTNKAFQMFPLALLLHQADEQASNFDETV